MLADNYCVGPNYLSVGRRSPPVGGWSQFVLGTATHPSPVPSGSLGCASSPMVSPLTPKHPCGGDCPEPRVPDEKTEVQRQV